MRGVELEAVVDAGREDAVAVEDESGYVESDGGVRGPGEHGVGDNAVGAVGVEEAVEGLAEGEEGGEEGGEVGVGDGGEVFLGVREEVGDGGREREEEEVDVGVGGERWADKGLVCGGDDDGDGDGRATAGEKLRQVDHGDHVAGAHQRDEVDAERLRVIFFKVHAHCDESFERETEH